MKRAQASLEFLTTYGWAFMVIILMIGALSYYGITDPSTFIPERCSFSPEISCEDFQIIYHSGSTMSIVMVNLKQTTGKSVYIADFICEDVDTGGGSLGYYHDDDCPDPVEKTLGRSLPLVPPSPDACNTHPDRTQWDPAEDVTVKCTLENNPFQFRVGDRVRIPVSLVINKRSGGFDHEIQGEVVGIVKEMT